MRRLAAATLVVAGALAALSGCSTTDVSGSPSQRVRGWIQGVGLAASSARIGSELADAARSARAGDLGGLQAVSVQLQDDATIAHAQLPSPDRILTDQLDAAYQGAYRLANDFLDHGVGPNRASGLSSVVSQADAAERALQSAEARAAQLTSR